MTTINKLEKALTSAQGLATELKTFSMDTNDQLAQTTENIAQTLESRINFVKSEEPQYRK